MNIADEEEQVSTDMWQDMLRNDANTAEETFRIMEQNIHKQFQASAKRAKSMIRDTANFHVSQAPHIPHRKSDHRGRVRTISSINGVFFSIYII